MGQKVGTTRHDLVGLGPTSAPGRSLGDSPALQAWWNLHGGSHDSVQVPVDDPLHDLPVITRRRLGFFHLGRFSQAYRARYQELPSQTLAR